MVDRANCKIHLSKKKKKKKKKRKNKSKQKFNQPRYGEQWHRKEGGLQGSCFIHSFNTNYIAYNPRGTKRVLNEIKSVLLNNNKQQNVFHYVTTVSYNCKSSWIQCFKTLERAIKYGVLTKGQHTYPISKKHSLFHFPMARYQNIPINCQGTIHITIYNQVC